MPKISALFSKIFRSRSPKRQLILASVGLLLGLSLLLFSFQLYLQINRLLNPEKAPPEYLVLSKKVGLGNTLFFSKSQFSPKEVRNLTEADFVEELGEFTANQFQVAAFLSGKIAFSTELFFESLPNQFLDIQPSDWHWKEGDQLVPIILSQDMLNLYNFGFAISKGFPQISPSTVGLIRINLRLRGPGGTHYFSAKIVGFSERISSILVPLEFMNWANTNIGGGGEENASRLIIKVKNPNDPALAKFIQRKNYQLNQDRLNASRSAAIVQIVMSVVGVLGLLFIALAMSVFIMNFRVILSEAQSEINLLLNLGYSESMITRYLFRFYAWLIGGISLLAFALTYTGHYFTQAFLKNKGLEVSGELEWGVLLLALGVPIAMLLLNYFSLKQIFNRLLA